MNTTYIMYNDMIISPLCIMPFSVKDFLYNPTCYTEPLLANINDLLRMYVQLNIMLTRALFGFIAQYWFPALYVAVILSMLGTLVNFIIQADNEEPLTILESEIAQYIYSNSSTGCTARMIYQHLYGFHENREVNMEEVTRALETLKKRGIAISVQSTLWLTTGK